MQNILLLKSNIFKNLFQEYHQDTFQLLSIIQNIFMDHIWKIRNYFWFHTNEDSASNDKISMNYIYRFFFSVPFFHFCKTDDKDQMI